MESRRALDCRCRGLHPAERLVRRAFHNGLMRGDRRGVFIAADRHAFFALRRVRQAAAGQIALSGLRRTRYAACGSSRFRLAITALRAELKAES